MHMKRKICLLLCLTLVLGLLTGCKLIVKDEAVDAATTAVEVNGEAITKGEVNEKAQLRQAVQQYIGLEIDDIETARSKVIDKLIRQKVIEQKMAQFGVDPITDEELDKAANAGLTVNSDDIYEQYTDYFSGDMATLNAMKAKLKGKATEGQVTVSEEALKETYQTKVEADQAAYTDQASYAAAINNGTESYYVPGEIRMVKQILIAFTDEEQNELKALKAEIKELKATVEASEATPAEATAEEAPADETADEAAEEEDPKAKLQRLEEEYNQKLAAACANVQEEVDHVMEELRNGGDWDAICAEHNDDPGMTAGRKTAETGYAVFEGYEDFDEVFVKAAMALESPGDFTDPTASAFGYYIIRLERDLTEGAIPFEDVRDALYETAYEEAEKELFDQLVEQWVSEANVVRHDEVFK